MNVGRLSLDNLERFGEYEALYFGGQAFTNVERARYDADLAEVLRQHGVAPGTMVLMQMVNSPEVASAFQTCWRLGATIIPVTPQLGPVEVGYMLQDSGARVVLTQPVLAPGIAKAVEALDTEVEVLVMGESDVPGAIDIQPEVEQAAGSFPVDELADRHDDDLALLLYTSGTTGKPKGVMLTHRNMLSNAESVAEMNPDVEPFERNLHVLPMSHSYGVLMMNLGYRFGSVSAMLPFFETKAVFEQLARYRVERFSVVPTMLTYMLSFPEHEDYDLSHLKKVNSGGAALPNEVRLEFERVFDCEVKEGYGMSECAPSATGYTDDEPYRPGSIGRPIPGVDVTIRNDAGDEVARGEWGEICIRGPNVMKGYWNLPEVTAETLKDGWLHSGDIGYMDEDGFIFITDRKKDLIIKGGENISPREIEEAIHEHPAVAEVAVIGLPDDKYGENICAVVHLKEGQEASIDDIKTHCAQSVTKFKVPARVEFFGDLPKSANGKILKRELRDQLTRAEETAAGA